MAISLCSTLVVLALVQDTAALPAPPPSPPPPPPADSIDARAQLALARAYLARYAASHPRAAAPDSVWLHRVLDTAEQALTRAAAALGAPGTSPTGDTARVLRVRVWSERARLAWEAGGLHVGPDSWGPLPSDLRLSPVLEELGENLLRACPTRGVLLTADDADSYAAWYMRFARGLRPDLLVVPLAVWRDDAALRARAARDLRLGPRGAAGGGGDGWLAALLERLPVCASMGLERPPDARGAKWRAGPLVWVAGPRPAGDPVAPRDFVFAALRLAVDGHDPWAQAAVALYARAARATPALCEALATFGVTRDVAACRR